MKTVITFGTFDIFHVGHLRILKRAKELGDRLVVGVSTDELNFNKKGKIPFYSEIERLEIVSGIKYVDDVFFEKSLSEKKRYILNYNADVLVMGGDWLGKFDDHSDVCEVKYLERTPLISTTAMIEKLSS